MAVERVTLKEFEVLGFKVKYSAEEGERWRNGDGAVDLVIEKTKALKNSRPQLDNTQIAILAALQLAEEKIALEAEYCENIDKLSGAAKEALKALDDAAHRPIQ